MRHRLLCALLILAGIVLPGRAQVLPTRDQLVFQAPNPIALRAGDGEVTFTLSNHNPEGVPAIPLALATGPILDEASQSVVPGATATLAPTVGGPTPPTSIASGQTLSLQASVKGILRASNATLPIFNGSSQLGTVAMFSSDAAFAISLDGDGTPDKPLAYTYDSPVVIALKNGDAESYHLHWIFQIDNQTESCGDLDVPPGGSSRIPIKSSASPFSIFGSVRNPVLIFDPVHKPFSIFDLVHPSNKKGVLLLSVVGPPNVRAGLLPARSLPISLVMQPASSFWLSFWSYAFAAFLLVIGGGLSFLGSSMLPNMQKKGDLRAQLQELANRTSAISTSVDSYLRVLLRLERSRISNLIDQASAWFPASADPLQIVSASIDTLSKRLAAAEQLDDIRRKHDQVAATAPPSVTDGIDASLQAAAEHLHSTALSETDLTAANGFLAKARAALDMIDDTDALANQIAGNVAVVTKRLEKFPTDFYADLKESLPGVFLIADPIRGYSDAKNIVRPMFFAIDHGAAAIQLALDYAMVRASIPVTPVLQVHPPEPPAANPADAASAVAATPANPPAIPAVAALRCDHLGQIARERLLKRQCVLIELLGTLSWRALRDATLLVQEMREDTYEEDVLDEICKPGQAVISFDTQKARPFQPVFFKIKFSDSRFNDAAALQRLICHWTFPDDLDEYTWQVCHYFSGYEHGTIAPSEFKQAALPQTDNSSTAAGPNQQMEAPHKRQRHFRLSTPPIKRELDLYATIRGQQPDEAREVPVPPLKKTIQIQSPSTTERSLFWAEILRFAIAFGVALAGLLSGALEQLNKLDIIPASIAIIGLGFGASALKNLLTQSATPQAPAPAPAIAKK